MRIRVLQGFADYTPGQVFDDWPGGMCELLIARGVIEEVSDESASADSTVEVAETAPSVERADASPRRKRK